MPRIAPVESVNCMKTLFRAGLNGIASEAVAKAAKVGMAFGGTLSVTDEAGALMQLPSAAVAQIDRLTGKDVAPVFRLAVIMSPAPTLTVATAKAPLGVAPEPSVIVPVLPTVAASATRSGTLVVEPDSSTVSSPVITAAGATPEQEKASCAQVGENSAVGVNDRTSV